MSAPHPTRRGPLLALACILTGLLVGAAAAYCLGYDREWHLVLPLLGALLGALAYRLSTRSRRAEPPRPTGASSPSATVGRAFLWLGPLLGALLGYALGWWIDDMSVFVPILSLGVVAGLIGFVTFLIAGR